MSQIKRQLLGSFGGHSYFFDNESVSFDEDERGFFEAQMSLVLLKCKNIRGLCLMREAEIVFKMTAVSGFYEKPNYEKLNADIERKRGIFVDKFKELELEESLPKATDVLCNNRARL